MEKLFSIDIGTDPHYEEFFTEVGYDNVTFAEINQERGIDKMEIKLYGPERSELPYVFPLDRMLKMLKSAKELLIESHEVREDDAE